MVFILKYKKNIKKIFVIILLSMGVVIWLKQVANLKDKYEVKEIRHRINDEFVIDNWSLCGKNIRVIDSVEILDELGKYDIRLEPRKYVLFDVDVSFLGKEIKAEDFDTFTSSRALGGYWENGLDPNLFWDINEENIKNIAKNRTGNLMILTDIDNSGWEEDEYDEYDFGLVFSVYPQKITLYK